MAVQEKKPVSKGNGPEASIFILPLNEKRTFV